MKIVKPNIKITKNYVKISLVECDCGNVFEIQNSRIKSQKYCIKCQKNSSIAHKMCYTRFYRTWTDIKTRGLNRYVVGKKPVGISNEWKKFQNFYSDMYQSYTKHLLENGEKNTTIDRIDNSKGYSKENCRWATISQQTKNRTITIMIGDKSLAEFCKDLNLSYDRTYQRIKRGWTIHELLNKKYKHHEKK